MFGTGGALLALTILMTLFIVPEGHVAVVKRFGEATHQVEPGLHWKVPFVDTITEIEVRTRRAQEELASATDEQMPVRASVSVNWTVNKSLAIDLFRQYGGLDQFENRILEPR